MPKIEQVQFKVLKPDDIPIRLQQDITRLDAKSLKLDFPDTPQGAIQRLACSFRDIRKDPNRAVGTAHYNPYQGFNHMRHVLVQNRYNERVVGHLAFGDNSSSSFVRKIPDSMPGVQNVVADAEIFLKLRTPLGPLTDSRYLYAGFCALSEEARDMIGETPADEVNVVDGLLLAGTGKTNGRLPFRAYPYAQETVWRQTLAQDGVIHLPHLDPGKRAIFGAQEPEVSVLAYGTDHRHQLTSQLMKKDGAELVLQDLT